MRKLLLLCLPMALLLATSCNKDSSDDASDIDLDCTYLKVRKGSKFTTKIESQNSAPQNYTSEVVSQEEVDGTLVAVAEGENGNKSYLTCEGEKFVITAQQVTTVETNTTVENILLTLDFGRPVGETYVVGTIVSSSSIQGYDFETTNRYEGTVIEKDLTMTVEGTTYSGVVKFEMSTFTESSLGGGEYKTTTTTYYVAPEVATIMAEVFDEFGGSGIISTTTLVSYEY